jgi:transcriptional regulator with XRE-family HTH domain
MGNAVKRDYSINERLRDYLVQQDKMPSRVADKAGIRRDTFSNIISSKRVIFAEEVPKIAEAAGCSVDYLLGCEEARKEE